MVYLYSSEHAHISNTADIQSVTTEGIPAMLEREDSMSMLMDDGASVASGFTVQSAATKSSIKSKKKVLDIFNVSLHIVIFYKKIQ